MAQKKKKQAPKKKKAPAKKKAAKTNPVTGNKVKLGPAGKTIEKQLDKGGYLADTFLPAYDDLIQYDEFKPEAYGSLLDDLAARAGLDPSKPGAYAGNITPEVQETIDKYKGNIDYSADVQDIIGRMRSGLEGYSAPELNAMREVQARQNQRALAGTMRNLATAQARSGVSGAAGALQNLSALNEANRAAQNLEQELFIKNADERWNRLGQFGTYMTGQEEAKQGRMRDYSNFLTGAQSDAYNRGNEARSAYHNLLGDMRSADFQRTSGNIMQQDKSKALQTAGSLGMAGLLQSQQDKNWLKEFMEKNPYSTAPTAFGGGGGGYAPGAGAAFDQLIAVFNKMSGLNADTGNSGHTMNLYVPGKDNSGKTGSSGFVWR